MTHATPSGGVCRGEARISDRYSPEVSNHSALAPDDLITLAHFSVNAMVKLLTSAGELGNTV